jgi:hypothetical protein
LDGALNRVARRSFERDRRKLGIGREAIQQKATESGQQPGSGKGERGNRSLLLVVHGVHSVGSLIIGSVANETETTAAAGIAVLDDSLEKKVRSDAIGRSEGQKESTYSLLNDTEFLEALAQRLVVCAPGETAGNGKWSVIASTTWKSTYPMKSLDMLIKLSGLDEGRDRRLGGVSVKRGIAELDLKYGLPPGPEQHLAMSRVLIFQANFIFRFFCLLCISIVASLYSCDIG